MRADMWPCPGPTGRGAMMLGRQRIFRKPPREKCVNHHLENLTIGVFFLALFIPVRLVFWTYVTDHWLGSVGIVTAILALLIYGANRGKLGYLGRLITKKIDKIRTHRMIPFLAVLNVLVLIVYGTILVAIAQGPDPAMVEAMQTTPGEGVSNMEDVRNQLAIWEPGPGEILDTILELLVLPALDFGMFASLIYVVDDVTGNWLSHFVIVFFVETLESLAIILYFRLRPARHGKDTGKAG